MNNKLKNILLWVVFITSLLATIIRYITDGEVLWVAMTTLWVLNYLISEQRIQNLENQLNNK